MTMFILLFLVLLLVITGDGLLSPNNSTRKNVFDVFVLLSGIA